MYNLSTIGSESDRSCFGFSSSISSRHKWICKFYGSLIYYLRIICAIYIVLAYMPVAKGDNYFEFTRSSSEVGRELVLDSIVYQGYTISDSGIIDNSHSSIQWVFGVDECRIIDHLVFYGLRYDKGESSIIKKHISTSLMPYHVLGDIERNSDYDGRFEIYLRKNPYREDGLWDISRIEVDAINVKKISEPSIIICGEELPVASEQVYNTVTRTFEDGESLINHFSISVGKGRVIGFRDIRVQLREPESYPQGWDLSAPVPQHYMGEYQLPIPQIGGIELAPTAQCIVYRKSDLSQASTLSVLDKELQAFRVTVPGFGDFGVAYSLNEVFYGLPIKYRAPSAERLLPFRIASEFISSYTLNDAPFMDGISYIHKDAPITTGHNWTNAVLGNIPEDVTVYWKVEQDDTFTFGETVEPLQKSRAHNSTEIDLLSDDDIPEGFTKYDEQTGIDLTQGNLLHLISEQNGSRSDVFSTHYVPYTGPTSVTLNYEEGAAALLQRLGKGDTTGLKFYNLQGEPLNYDNTPTGTILIVISDTGKSVKIRKI